MSLVVDIVEIFEDFLKERGITVPTSEAEMREDGEDCENDVIIYGSDFCDLSDKINDCLSERINEVIKERVRTLESELKNDIECLL